MEIKELKTGETVRCYITAERWIDIKHNGWTVEASSPKGVGVRQEARNVLSIITLDTPDEDEL